MTTETATAISDVLLSAGTFGLGLTVGPKKNYRAWSALFITMAIAAALGAIYHGMIRYHTREFWTCVAISSTASGFLFLGASICSVKPQWTWLHWMWPLMALVGLLVGGLLAPYPFWTISAVSGLCMVAAVFILKKAPSASARKWIYFGVATIVLGLGAQQFGESEGPMNHNVVFHYLQLLGNTFIWMGARRT